MPHTGHGLCQGWLLCPGARELGTTTYPSRESFLRCTSQVFQPLRRFASPATVPPAPAVPPRAPWLDSRIPTSELLSDDPLSAFLFPLVPVAPVHCVRVLHFSVTAPVVQLPSVRNAQQQLALHLCPKQCGLWAVPLFFT